MVHVLCITKMYEIRDINRMNDKARTKGDKEHGKHSTGIHWEQKGSYLTGKLRVF